MCYDGRYGESGRNIISLEKQSFYISCFSTLNGLSNTQRGADVRPVLASYCGDLARELKLCGCVVGRRAEHGPPEHMTIRIMPEPIVIVEKEYPPSLYT